MAIKPLLLPLVLQWAIKLFNVIGKRDWKLLAALRNTIWIKHVKKQLWWPQTWKMLKSWAPSVTLEQSIVKVSSSQVHGVRSGVAGHRTCPLEIDDAQLITNKIAPPKGLIRHILDDSRSSALIRSYIFNWCISECMYGACKVVVRFNNSLIFINWKNSKHFHE